MTHPSAQTLRDYCDFQLGDELRAEVHSHIEQCADCRAFLNEEESLVHALTHLGGVQAPEALPRLIMERVRSDSTTRATEGKRARVAGLGLLFLGSLLLTVAAGLTKPVEAEPSLFTTIRTMLSPVVDQFPRMELPNVLSFDNLLAGHSRTIELALLVGVILAMLALLDRYVLQPLTRQQRGV